MDKDAQPLGFTVDPAQLALLDTVLAAIRSGAEQYLSQTGEGETPTPAGVATELPRQQVEPSPLTRRQRQVLRQMALGFVTKEIAYQLHLSPKTVAAHRMHIMERLDIHDLAGLVIYALRQGLVGLDDYEQRRGHR